MTRNKNKKKRKKGKGNRAKGSAGGGGSKRNYQWRSPIWPLQPVREEASLAREVVTLFMAYERSTRSTEVGRRAMALCDRGMHLHHDEESPEAAHEVFLQAAALFEEDDTSAAAAAVWHHLADSYRDLPTGVKLENLEQAQTLYLRALASPDRLADPQRCAKSMDDLAICMRDAAQALHGPESDELLAMAYQLQVQACELAVQLGLMGWYAAAGYLHNLGNLCLVMGDLDQAIDALEESCRHWDAIDHYRDHEFVLPLPESEIASQRARVLWMLAGARMRRFRTDDRKRIARCLDLVVASGQETLIDEAHLVRAQLYLRLGGTYRDLVEGELDKIVLGRLPAEQGMNVIDTLVKAGLLERACDTATWCAQDALTERDGAESGRLAVYFSAEAEGYAVRAAQLNIERGHPIAAFLALEWVSGHDYGKQVVSHSWRPREPITRELYVQMRQYASRASFLDDMADSRATLGEEETREQMAAQLTQPDSVATLLARTPEYSHLLTTEELEILVAHNVALGEVIRRAQAASAPADVLREEAERLYHEHHRRWALGRARDPEFNAERRPWQQQMSEKSLVDVAREHPECAFVHIHLLDELMVSTVWWTGSELTGRADCWPIPGGGAAVAALLNFESNDTDLLGAFDLAAALPPERMTCGVLVPSLLASRLPLAALGRPGHTLLDRFEELTWLPKLTPMWMRQAPTRPRRGTLTVAPGGTGCRDIGLAVELPDETVLRDSEVTLEQVMARVKDVDVVSFYSHGRHPWADLPTDSPDDSSHQPGIELAGGERLLHEYFPGKFWAGIERVEIWACESSVGLPNDPFALISDESFGLDAELHPWGVRSTIAALWNVPDFVTACIVDRYRKHLLDGASAPRALACAQRWWRDEGVAMLRECVDSEPHDRALAVFLERLAIEQPVVDPDAALGPAPTSPAELDALVARVSGPRAWAGLRFLGVAERRPTEPWLDDYERPMNDDEQAELAALLAAEDEGQSDSDLALMEALPGAEMPSPEVVIGKARGFRDRTIGASRHNLLRGLAWLHEAMMGSALTARQWSDLAVEAVWMWLDVARCEIVSVPELLERPKPTGILQRIERLLAEIRRRDALDDTLELDAAEVWVSLLARELQLDTFVEEIVTVCVEAIALTTRVDVNSWRSLRALSELMDLVALNRELPAESARMLLEPTRRIEQWDGVPPGVKNRLMAATTVIAWLGGLPERYEHMPASALTHRNLARKWLLWTNDSPDDNRPDGPEQPDEPEQTDKLRRTIEFARDDELSWLNACFWDDPVEPRDTFWRSSGTPGSAHRAVISSDIEGQLKGPHGAEMATQAFQKLQRLCDLRLQWLTRWARVFGWPEQDTDESLVGFGQYFFDLVKERELLLEALEDAASVPVPDSIEGQGHVSDAPWGMLPSDPFVSSDEEIVDLRHSDEASQFDVTAWTLVRCNVGGMGLGLITDTAAFHSLDHLNWSDRQALEQWNTYRDDLANMNISQLRGDAQGLFELDESYMGTNVLEPMLHDLSEGQILLGLTTSPSRALVGWTLMKLRGCLVQRSHVIDNAVLGVIIPLARLLHASLERGVSTSRRKPWELLRAALEPMLEALLPEELPDTAVLMVLAPGNLRALPWAGLQVRGEPLYRAVSAILHLPAIGFVQHTGSSGDKRACLLAQSEPRNQPQSSDGETRFGAATIETLRAWFPPDVQVEKQAPRRRDDIVEAEAIEPVAHELGSLRIYGTANWSPNKDTTTSGVALSNNRVFMCRDASSTFMPQCSVVELWAATGCEGAVHVALHNDRDRIPGLAWAFLASGAASVLDLAWPVHDVIKALVCEHFGILTRGANLGPALALNRALAWTASILAAWRKSIDGSPSIAEALAALDELRRQEAEKHGLRADAMKPFAALAGLPCVSSGTVEDLLDELCQPVHLAAFRLWGGAEERGQDDV